MPMNSSLSEISKKRSKKDREVDFEKVTSEGAGVILDPRMNPHQSTRLKQHFFTWNNYCEKSLVMLLSWVKTHCVRWCFQEEIGESGTPHIQGCITLKEAARWTTFDLPKQIHWEPTRNNKKAEIYCSKDETRLSGAKVYRYPLPLVKTPLKLIEKLRPFQLSIIDSLVPIPDDRTINWICDEKTNMGKTQLCKYLFVKHKAILFTGGACADIAQTLVGVIEAGKIDLNDQLNPFIFNISKSSEHISYKAIEGCKDGLLNSPKYESQTLVFNSPHIWIFANREPDYDKMSIDRWKIWTINDDFMLVPHNWNYRNRNIEPTGSYEERLTAFLNRPITNQLNLQPIIDSSDDEKEHIAPPGDNRWTWDQNGNKFYDCDLADAELKERDDIVADWNLERAFSAEEFNYEDLV
nr:putative replication associated protein [Crucivirus sp.]